jgi:MarR family 2-MHQ and catechol resistance regulon transcriptional repressor
MRYDRASIVRAGFNSLTDFALLELLLHKGPQPVNTLGRKILLTSGSITTAVQRLAKRGLVSRRRCESDGRLVIVELTADGSQLIRQAFDAHAAELDALFDTLTDDEKTLFANLIRKIGRSAEAKLK